LYNLLPEKEGKVYYKKQVCSGILDEPEIVAIFDSADDTDVTPTQVNLYREKKSGHAGDNLDQNCVFVCCIVPKDVATPTEHRKCEHTIDKSNNRCCILKVSVEPKNCIIFVSQRSHNVYLK
jgi:hypothetical protein